MTEPTPSAPIDARVAARGRRRWLWYAVAGAVAALLAIGVAGYALTRPVEPGFDSPEAIAELLAERGAPCADFAPDDDGLADRRGTCYADGKRIVIATFDNRAGVEAHWQRQLGAAPEGQGVDMVIGDTWSISGEARAYLRHAAEVLEAEFRSN